MDVGFEQLLERVDDHQFWMKYLGRAVDPDSAVGIHLAIFAQPFLALVLGGDKTIESRFSRNRCAPYGEICDGDVILLKEVGGPICGLALATRAWCYNLTLEPIDKIREQFGLGVCADDDFWASRADANYATLIELGSPLSIEPVDCDKRDRRGWVALRSRQQALF
jgi:hypothetical protein